MVYTIEVSRFPSSSNRERLTFDLERPELVRSKDWNPTKRAKRQQVVIPCHQTPAPTRMRYREDPIVIRISGSRFIQLSILDDHCPISDESQRPVHFRALKSEFLDHHAAELGQDEIRGDDRVASSQVFDEVVTDTA